MKPSKKEFKPLAMKCNQDQFDRIKPKLEKAGNIIYFIHSFDTCEYLTNNLGGGKTISNICESDKKDRDRTVHETWNEEIFLNACCIETEPTYTITKQQIWDMDNFGYGKAREWFPEVFDAELETGKWYKVTDKGNSFLRHEYALVMYSETEKHTGFAYRREEWTENFTNLRHLIKRGTDSVEEATHEEVLEALKSEAVRRGYEGKDIFIMLNNKKYQLESEIGKYNLALISGLLFYQGASIFNNGVWAYIIKPKKMTQSDIEKELGYLIEIV